MTLNENKSYDVINIDGSYGSKVSTENMRVYKARKTCGMLMFTAPLAVKGRFYDSRVDKNGVITYTPLGEIPLEVIAKEELFLCKAVQAGPSLGLNARLAKPGAYYFNIADPRGVITYIPVSLVGGDE